MSNFEVIPGYGQGMRLGRDIGAAIGWLFFILTRPLGLLSTLLLRTSMGERYFNRFQLGASFLLIGVAQICTATVPVTFTREAKLYQMPNGFYEQRTIPRGVLPDHPILIGNVWVVLLAIAAAHHLFQVRRRRKAGLRHHSRFTGNPRIPSMYPSLQYVVLVVCSLGLVWAGFHFYAMLLFTSSVQTMAEDYRVKRELYNRALDVIDAELDSEELSRAIRNRFSPSQTSSNATWLPAGMSTSLRERFAHAFRGSVAASTESPHLEVKTLVETSSKVSG